MAYSVTADLVNAITNDTLIELTDDVDGGVVIELYVTDAISKADTIIDAYLRAQQGTLPLSPVPPLINGISVDFAIYFLYRRRRDTEADELDEGIEIRYKKAMDLLKDVNS